MSDKIIFVIPDMPGGGTERVVALLANEYATRGIETSVLLFAGHQTAYPLGDKVEVVSLGEPSGGSIAKRISRICRMRAYYRRNRGAAYGHSVSWEQCFLRLPCSATEKNTDS